MRASHEVTNKDDAAFNVTPHFEIARLARGTAALERLVHGQPSDQAINYLEKTLWIASVIAFYRGEEISNPLSGE